MSDWVYNNHYEIITKSDISILTLSSTNDILEFIKEYKITEDYLGEFGYINWKQVKLKYDGIEINPYKRLPFEYFATTIWHNSWDCSSGCIWNLNKIERIKKI